MFNIFVLIPSILEFGSKFFGMYLNEMNKNIVLYYVSMIYKAKRNIAMVIFYIPDNSSNLATLFVLTQNF